MAAKQNERLMSLGLTRMTAWVPPQAKNDLLQHCQDLRDAYFGKQPLKVAPTVTSVTTPATATKGYPDLLAVCRALGHTHISPDALRMVRKNLTFFSVPIQEQYAQFLADMRQLFFAD
jgi:hypothetical protein